MNTDNNRILWARGISETGNAIRQAILALAILSVRDNPNDVFTAEVLETIGVIAIMLVGPSFIDRVNRKKSLVASDIFCVANALFLFLGALHNSIEALFVGSFFTTFFASFYQSNLKAMTAEAGDGDIKKVKHGLSMIQISVLIGAIVGLLGTTFALPKFELKYFFLFDSLTFIVSSVLVYGIKETSSVDFPQKKPWIEWIEGLRYSLKFPTIKLVIFSGIFGGITYGILESTSVVHLKNSVGLDDFWLTATRAINRVGSIAAFVLMFWASKKFPNLKGQFWILAGGVLAILGIFCMSSHTPVVFILSGLILFPGTSFLNPSLSAVIGASTDKNYLGRVFTFYSLSTYIGVLFGNLIVFLGRNNITTGEWLQVSAYIFVGRIGLGIAAQNRYKQKATSSA